MPSEIDNLKTILMYYFNIQPSDIFLGLSLGFILVCAYYGLQRGFYQGLGSAFVALTFCTLLRFVPPHIYAMMCILLAMIIAGKFFNFGGK
jgi:hypothetical protein